MKASDVDLSIISLVLEETLAAHQERVVAPLMALELAIHDFGAAYAIAFGGEPFDEDGEFLGDIANAKAAATWAEAELKLIARKS